MDDIFDDIPELDTDDKPVRRHRHKPVIPKPKAAAINTGDRVKVVYWRVIQCPYCGSKKVPVVHSASPVRYHKCGDCGETFKSIEK